METLSQKYNILVIEAEKQIAIKVNKIGVKSEFTHNKTIKISDNNFAFNLGSGNWLVEVAKDNLISNYGYNYGFDDLEADEFFALADYIKGLKK